MKAPYHADVAVITALPLEALAALTLFDGTKFRTYMAGHIAYHVANISSKDGKKSYRVVISTTQSYGASPAASLTDNFIHNWNPQTFLIAGIAGGMDPGLNLGDVVVSDSIIKVNFVKIRGGGTSERAETLPISQELTRRVIDLPEARWLRLVEKLSPPQDSFSPRQRKLGQILSGNAVVSSTEKKKELTKRFPELIAVEMEAFGVIDALREIYGDSEPPRVCVIKGISDLADDEKQDTEWRQFAAHASIAYIRGLLLEGILEAVSTMVAGPPHARLASEAEQQNWIGETELRHGRHDAAFTHFERAWDLDSKPRRSRRALSVRADIGHNLSIMHRLRGDVTRAHKFGKVALLMRHKAGEDLADSYFELGLITREYGDSKNAIRYFDRAKDLYYERQNVIGYTSALRWKGYAYYTTGDYLRAFDTIADSHKQLTKRQLSYDRLPEGAESFDMFSRALRQVILPFTNNPRAYREYARSQNCMHLPDSLSKSLAMVFAYIQHGERIAFSTGDNYKLTESYLSYVRYFYEFPELPMYRDLRLDAGVQLLEYYKRASQLARHQNYNLLICQLERYVGNAHYNIGRYAQAFEHYATRYETAIKVRATEQMDALESISTRIIGLPSDRTRRQYLHLLLDRWSGRGRLQHGIEMCNTFLEELA